MSKRRILGERGAKQRYSVYKTESKQRSFVVQERTLKTLCERENLNFEDFVDETDGKYKWKYALERFFNKG